MALLFLCPTKDPEPWRTAFHNIDPNLEIIWDDTSDPAGATVAVVWNHPRGALAGYPNLKAVISLGAGVDHLLQDTSLPRDLPIARVVDPNLAQSMRLYVTSQVLRILQHHDAYTRAQLSAVWKPLPAIDVGRNVIGVMGLGEMGGTAARALRDLGLDVAGWSRTPRLIEGITTYAGPDEYTLFLQHLSILICLLPFTPATAGLLNHTTFNHLPKGAFVINAARGGHLVDDDLLAALDAGHLAGAILDVFHQEPLPSDHPFWSHPKIVITPHVASLTDPNSAAKQIVENYRRALSGAPLLHAVDVEAGY